MYLGCLFIAIFFIYFMTKAKAAKMASKATAVVKSATRHGSTYAGQLGKVLEEAEAMPATRGGWLLSDGIKHLVGVDKKFADLIGEHGIPEAFRSGKTRAGGVAPLPVPTGNPCEQYFSLLKIIIYQQLAASSAEPILNRFVAAFGVKERSQLTPQVVSKAKFETTTVDGKRKVLLNGVVSGLSESKAKYIQDLTAHFLDPEKLGSRNLADLSDDELRSKLLGVSGLGPWSVDMFMLFDLQRANVLPMGDLVVRKGVARFHGLPETYFDNKKNLLQVPQLCAKWAPFASLATCYMWKVKSPMKDTEKAQKRTRKE